MSQRRQTVGQHRPPEAARNVSHRRRIRRRIGGLRRPSDDHAVPVHHQPRHLRMQRTLARRSNVRKKPLPVDSLDRPRRDPAIVDRRQRIAKRRIQMHRTAPRTHRPPHGVRHRLSQVTQPRLARLRHREFMKKINVPAEQLLLIDRLPRRTRPHLGRTIRRDHEQRHPTLLRLNHGRKVIRPRRATRTHEHGRPPLALRDPQCKKRRRPLVEHRHCRDLRLPHQGKRQRRRPRPRRNHGLPHAEPPQRLREHTTPE